MTLDIEAISDLKIATPSQVRMSGDQRPIPENSCLSNDLKLFKTSSDASTPSAVLLACACASWNKGAKKGENETWWSIGMEHHRWSPARQSRRMEHPWVLFLTSAFLLDNGTNFAFRSARIGNYECVFRMCCFGRSPDTSFAFPSCSFFENVGKQCRYGLWLSSTSWACVGIAPAIRHCFICSANVDYLVVDVRGR